MRTRKNTWKLKLASVACLFLLAGAGQLFAQNQNDPQALKIVNEFENKLNLYGFDITDTFNLVQIKPGESDRVLRIKVYRRDAADLFTLIFEYPPSEQGKGYLRDGNNLYLYLPSTREFVYRNRKDNVGSTNVRTDTFGRLNLQKRYWITYKGQAKIAQWECDVIHLDARALDVSYPIQTWYVRKSDGLPVKVLNYSASGTLLLTQYYIQYKQVAPGKYIFTKLLALNDLTPGEKTFITNDGITTAAIPNYVFTKAYLEQQSR